MAEQGEQATEGRDVRNERARLAGVAVGWVASSVAVLVLLQGLLIKVWYGGHIPIDSDEAIDGLMATSIQHGHTWAFYWGQSYGGIEPYLTSGVLWILPDNGVALRVTATVIVLIGMICLWRAARNLLESRPLALGVTAVSFAFPLASVIALAHEYGFRSTTVALSFALLLVGVRIAEASDGAPLWSFALAGLLGGLGWWSSPEIVFFGVAAAICVIGGVGAIKGWRRRASAMAALAGAAFVGSIPWWWVSLSTNFSTLHSAAASEEPFSGRLGIFITHVVPLQFGFQQPYTGKALLVPGRGLTHDVILWLIVALVALASIAAIAAGRGRRAVGIAALVSPFLYAASPAAWYWIDGRYAVYLLPLYLLVLAIGLERIVGRKGRHTSSRWRSLVVSATTLVVLVGAMSWTGWQFDWLVRDHFGSKAGLFSEYSASDGGMVPLASQLRGAEVTTGWADYWVAYRLDFLSGGHLVVSPTPNQSVRNDQILAEVKGSSEPVWLVRGGRTRQGESTRLKDQSPSLRAWAPGGITWGELKQRFESIGVTFTTELVGSRRKAVWVDGERMIKHHGGIWVVRTDRRVAPLEVGMGRLLED